MTRRLPVLSLLLASAALLSTIGTSHAQVALKMTEDFSEGGRACGTPTPTTEEGAALESAVNAWLKQPNRTFAGGQIKVAFHVIYNTSGEGNIPQTQIDAQIATLNNEYSTMGFSFVLDSVDRTASRKWFGMVPGGGAEKSAKQSLAIDPAHRLNVYTCKPGQSLLGWAYFPNSYPENSYMHGVVIHYASVPGGALSAYNEGETLTHEIGHYLGLYHTFQGGCTAPGDYVDDTPYEASAYTGGDCSLQRDTCPSAGLDPISNYMDYSYDRCMTNFTTGQKNRMQAITPQYRPSLLNAAARALEVASLSPAVREVASEKVAFAGAVPNPSRGGTTLEYSLPRATSVSLRLYSVSGRLVSTIEQGDKDAGAHSVSFAGRSLAPGTYFAVLAADGQRITRTVILQ
jgi:hypothetical protein